MEELEALVKKYKHLEMDKAGYTVKGPLRSKVILHPDPNRIFSKKKDGHELRTIFDIRLRWR
jgi:hypothetical protein